MGTVRYTVIDGEVVAQERDGVRHQLVPDPLGSTVALYDNAGTKTDAFSYWPYGESSGRSGTTITNFQYIGSYGYYKNENSNYYVRSRFLSSSKSVWISSDFPLYQVYEEPYVYVSSNPIRYIDVSGMQKIDDCEGMDKQPVSPCPTSVINARNRLCKIINDKIGIIDKPIVTGPRHKGCLSDWCSPKKQKLICHPDTAPHCNVGVGQCAYSCGVPGTQLPGNSVNICVPRAVTPGCNNNSCKDKLMASILHEINGVCGVDHGPSGNFEDKCDLYGDMQCRALGI